MNNIGIIILASSSTSDSGIPKHLMKIKGESQLRKSVKTAINVSTATLTVLGHNYSEHLKEIKHLKTLVMFNLDWNKGMSNCARFGLHEINKSYPGLEAIILMTCKEPIIDEKILFDLIKAHRRGHYIVSYLYHNKLGLPILFDRKFFKEILKTGDETGLSELIERNKVFSIRFPKKYIQRVENWKIL